MEAKQKDRWRQLARAFRWVAVCLTLAALLPAATVVLPATAWAQPAEAPPLPGSDDDGSPFDPNIAAGRTIAPAAGAPNADLVIFRNLGIVALVFGASLAIGHYLSRWLRMPEQATRMTVVAFAIIAGSAACYFDWPPKYGIDLKGGVILIYEVEQTDFKEMDKLVAAVNKRVNPGGIKEVTVRPYGEREIEIIVPEADQAEEERMKEIIRRQGRLEFRIVADDRFDSSVMEVANAPENKDKRVIYLDADESGAESERIAAAKWVPVKPDEVNQLRSGHTLMRETRRGRTEILVLIDPINVTGDYLTNATAGRDQVGRPSVNFSFNTRGSNKFGELTGNNLPDPAHPDLRRLLAIILDGELNSAPSIKSQIRERGEIEGNFTEKEVEDLAAVLTAGSLPTTLRSEPTTSLRAGPTLGQDTREKGIMSMLVSTVAVVVFMIVYYRFAGIVANLALLLNVLLIVAFMILFNAAFTLSGLAGLALTVGMAVDANVLIYERMREELSRGSTLRMAIRNGFDRATTTIVDANVTTLISAIVLYWIGTDQVKGFAVTLILGIVMNLFTAITFTRLLFDVAEKQRWITQLKMLQVMANPNFDFIGKRFAAVALSALLIGAGLVGVFARGKGLLDIDFTGGTSVEAVFEQPGQDIGEIRELVQNLPDVTVQDVHITGEPAGQRFLIITSKPDSDEVKKDLKRMFSDSGHRLASNQMKWENVKPITTAGAGVQSPPSEEAKPDDSKKAKADDTQQSRHDFGGQTLLALADDASPGPEAKGPATKGPATKGPATKGPETGSPAANDQGAGDQDDKDEATSSAGAKPEADEATSSDEPAAAEKDESDQKPPVATGGDPYIGGTTATLRFTQAVDYTTLSDQIKRAAASLTTDDDVLFEISNPEYEANSRRGFEEWTLRVALPAQQATTLLEHLQTAFADEPFFPSSNKVGASVAGNTQLQATNALLASLVLIVVYVWIRFQQVSFGFAAVLALVHDVLVALGALALSYWLARIPFMEMLLIEPFKINLPIIAAFLTIIGYSINDTIVIFDRIREVRGKSPDMPPELVNLCINQTLSRTLLTSLTVFIVVLILYIFGGQGVHGFAFTLVVGTISGTYSTVYIATPVLIWMNQGRSAGKRPSAAMGREATVR